MYLCPTEVPLWMLYLSSIWGGLGLSVTYLLPWTMLPDVIDEDELIGGVRREALFYSFFVLFQKFASGIGLGLSTLVLEFAGYITDPCCGVQQPESVGNSLRIMLGLLPIGLHILSFFFTVRYPITTEVQQATKRLLMERKKTKSTAYSSIPADEQSSLLSSESSA